MANELRVRQLAIGGLVEDAPLTSGATTLTSAGLSAVSGGIGSTQHLAVVLDPDGIDGAPEIAYVSALTAGAGSATVTRGQEGTTARQHVAGTPWVHGATLRDVVRATSAVYSGGDFTFTNTTYADLRTDIDLTISAFVGDILEVGIGLVTTNNGSSSYVLFDAQTRVGGSGVNTISGGLTDGVSAWLARTGATANEPVTCSGSWFYTVVSGDLASGATTLRLRNKVSAGTGTVYAGTSTARNLQWFVKNLGPPSA